MGNLLNYTNYDFEDLVEQLQNRLKTRKSWIDTYRSGTGQMMIEFYAYVANLVLYYIERRAEECFIDTAQLRSSVINLVKLLNYLPKRQTSSLGTLTFSVSSAHTVDIILPAKTVIKTGDDLYFFVGKKETDDTSGDYTGNIVGASTLLTGETSVTVNAIQGEVIEKEIISDGSASQNYNIEETNVENDLFAVFVDSIAWTQVSSFVSSESDDSHYMIRQNKDNSLRIIFGDGIKGDIPDEDSVVKLQYVLTDGLDGNVYTGDSIINIVSTIYDTDSNTVSDISVTNSSTVDAVSGNIQGAFVGGDEEESIEEIKYEAPRVFATGDRLITKADFIAVIENYSGVGSANVWGEYEEDDDAAYYNHRINLCILMQENDDNDWPNPTTAFKTELTDYLYLKSVMTVKYEYVVAVQLNVIPTLTLVVSKNYSITQAQADINTLMTDQFELGVTTKLGTALRYSNLVNLVDSLDAVSYHQLILEIRKDLVEDYGSNGEYGEALDAVSVKKRSVRVFVDDGTTETQVAMDDGDGALTTTDEDSESFSDYTVTGTVDYTTGVIELDIDPDPSSLFSMFVRYQQDSADYPFNEGDIVPTYRQISKLYDVEFASVTQAS